MDKEMHKMMLAFEKLFVALTLLLILLAVMAGGTVMIFKFAYWLVDLEF